MSEEKGPGSDRLKPISLWPLPPKRALRLFMQVDWERVLAAEKAKKEARK